MRPQDVLIKQNLPGGTSAVVPPDPMPNSEVKRRSADGSVGSPHVRVGNCRASNKAESSVGRLSFFAFVSSGEDAGMPPRWRCALRGYGSDMEPRPGSPARGAQHRLRRKSHHISLIIFIQSNIKPRRGNPFAIIHFFLAPALALIAKTVLTKKNVNAITYKDITII